MVILTCLPTARNVAWFAKLHNGLLDRHEKLFPSIKQYMSIITKRGFELHTKLNILCADILKDYHDAEGPLKEDWRKGDIFVRTRIG